MFLEIQRKLLRWPFRKALLGTEVPLHSNSQVASRSFWITVDFSEYSHFGINEYFGIVRKTKETLPNFYANSYMCDYM
ncbi:hypothetical protein P8452_64705 [Trifolium repens]|nr:hypothetical protein P8452_64705 [Trifolium repens]